MELKKHTKISQNYSKTKEAPFKSFFFYLVNNLCLAYKIIIDKAIITANRADIIIASIVNDTNINPPSK